MLACVSKKKGLLFTMRLVKFSAVFYQCLRQLI